MTGLDKIVDQIINEANNSANEILEKARSEAEEVKQQAAEEAQAQCETILHQSDAQIAGYRERMKSSADLKRRTAVLEAKQTIISQTIDKAYETFCAKSDDQYFNTIREMIGKFALADSGVIFFSAKDLARMPEGFAAEMNEIASKKGGSLTLSSEPRHLEGGFILDYGGIEENCSFEALFNSKRDELQDKVQKVLFS